MTNLKCQSLAVKLPPKENLSQLDETIRLAKHEEIIDNEETINGIACCVNWCVMSPDNSCFYDHKVSLATTQSQAIENFLQWCRLRRGVKNWKAWQRSGYYLTQTNREP